MDELLEKVKDLLRISTENVSANHWIPAIHEDKHEGLAQELVNLLSNTDVVSEKPMTFTKEDMIEFSKQARVYENTPLDFLLNQWINQNK